MPPSAKKREAPPPDAGPLSDSLLVFVVAALILFVGLLAFLNSLATPFLFDDVARIVENPSIQSFRLAILNSTRPLVDLTFHLNFLLSGLHPPGYHAVNVSIHLAAALALFGVIRRWLLVWGAAGGRAASLAGIVAALWVAHPLQTESVTYVVQRAESMMGLALLGTLYLALRALDAQRPDRWETAAIVVCALGMACKPIMVVAPLIVWCGDRVLVTRVMQAASARRWALYSGLCATWLIPLALLSVPNESTESAGWSQSGITVLQYARSQPGVVLHYLRLVFWPRPLCLDYAWPIAMNALDILPGVAVVGGLLVASIVAFARRRAAGFIGVACFLLLAPTSSLFPVADIAFEHRMYLPLGAVLSAVVLGGDRVCRYSLGRWPRRSRGVYVGVGALVLVALMGSVWLTRTRNQDYASPLQMWVNVVEQRPENYLARCIRVEMTLQMGRYREAEPLAGRLVADIIAAEQAPTTSVARVRASIAGFYYHRALDQQGRALLSLDRADEALAHFEEARRAKPESASLAVNTAIALNALGRQVEAIDLLEHAKRLDFRQADTWALLGRYRMDAGQYDLAKDAFEYALRLKPSSILVQRDLAWILACAPDGALRDVPRALVLARAVCAAAHDQSVTGLDVLAATLAAHEEWRQAEEVIDKALALAVAPLAVATGAGGGGVPELSARRELYRQFQTYRLPAPSTNTIDRQLEY